MDETSWALVLALSLDLAISVTVFLLYLVVKKYRSQHVGRTQTAPFNEAEYSVVAAWKKTWAMSMPEVSRYCSIESQMFLELQKTILWLLAAMTVLAFAILVPVYSVGEDEIQTELEKIGFSHVSKSPELAAAIAFCLILSSGFSYWIVLRFVENTLVLSSEKEVTSAWVQITGLNTEKLAEAVKSELKNTLEQNSEEIIVLPDYRKAYKVLEDYIANCKLLTHYQALNEVKGGRVRIGVCRKRDAVEHYFGKLLKLKGLLEEEVAQAQFRNCGVAFVRLTNPGGELPKKGCAGGEETYEADQPAEIQWRNVHINQKKMRCRRLSITLGFLLLFMVVLTPATFLNYVGAVADANPALVGFMACYIPTLALLVYQSGILPIIVYYIVKLEKHSSLSREMKKTMILFLLYMVTHVFLVPAMGLQVIDFVAAVVQGDLSEIGTGMVSRVVVSALFFNIMIVHSVFIGNGFYLLQFGVIAKILWGRRNAVTEEERQVAHEAVPFKFPLRYAESLNLFAIVLSFSLVFPVILAFGFCYFLIRYFIHKYNLLFVFYSPKICCTTLQFTATSLLMAVFSFQLVTSAVIALVSEDVYTYLGVTLFLLSVVGFLLFKHSISEQIKKPKRIGSNEIFNRSEEFRYTIEAKGLGSTEIAYIQTIMGTQINLIP